MEEKLSPYGGELDYYIFKLSNAPRLARGGHGQNWNCLKFLENLSSRYMPRVTSGVKVNSTFHVCISIILLFQRSCNWLSALYRHICIYTS